MDSNLKPNPAKLLLELCLSFILLPVLAACAVNMNTVCGHAKGCPVKAESQDFRLKLIAEENSKVLAWYRENEWQFHKGDKSTPPDQCICLSGGGIRSAAFSIGVLKGLHEKGILDKIDIISGVSGGSFALSWYYLQQYGKDPNDKEALFSSTYHDELLKRPSLYTYPDLVATFLGNIILVPTNILFNTVFSLNVDTSLSRRFYEQAIRRTFHGGKDCTFQEMLDFIKNQNLPYFIINTSAAIDYSQSYHGSKLSNRVFEFTPLRFGSDGFGYSNEFPVTVGRAVAISGAAVDLTSEIPGRLESTFLSSLNIDLGYNIKNYNKKDIESGLKRLVPFYSLAESRDINGIDIRLTDGGHTENLGMYSLVRRLCRKIIVVDATYDPSYRFNDFYKLKNALRNEMQVELEVQEIDRLQQKLQLEKLNENSNTLTNTKFSDTSNAYNAMPNYSLSSSVMKGSISYFPVEASDGSIDQRRIDVIYIKLSINDNLFHGFPTDNFMADVYSDARGYYGRDLVEYYVRSRINKDCGEWLFGCEFPQYTTWDQSYTSKQFNAYIDLGYKIIINEFR